MYLENVSNRSGGPVRQMSGCDQDFPFCRGLCCAAERTELSAARDNATFMLYHYYFKKSQPYQWYYSITIISYRDIRYSSIITCAKIHHSIVCHALFSLFLHSTTSHCTMFYVTYCNNNIYISCLYHKTEQQKKNEMNSVHGHTLCCN